MRAGPRFGNLLGAAAAFTNGLPNFSTGDSGAASIPEDMQSLQSLLSRLRELRIQLEQPSAYVSLAFVASQKAEIERDIAVLEDLIRDFGSDRDGREEAAA
jgi:bacterioferritin (cytochrome b1)